MSTSPATTQDGNYSTGHPMITYLNGRTGQNPTQLHTVVEVKGDTMRIRVDDEANMAFWLEIRLKF